MSEFDNDFVDLFPQDARNPDFIEEVTPKITTENEKELLRQLAQKDQALVDLNHQIEELKKSMERPLLESTDTEEDDEVKVKVKDDTCCHLM